MALPDSTYTKRQVSKRSISGPNTVSKAISNTVSDVTGGFRELQRQMGSAVSTVKSGYEKIRRSLK